MNNVLAILDANDLLSVESAQDYFGKRSLAEIASLAVGLAEAVQSGSRSLMAYKMHHSLDEANFLPSSSMRASRSCANWSCRVARIELMARYAALYCDRVVVPINIEPPDPSSNGMHETIARMSMASTVAEIITLRPLIEERLAVLVPEELHFCERHWDERVPEHKRIVRAANGLARLNSRKFKVTYEPQVIAKQLVAAMQIDGPEDYVEHGSMRRVLGKIPAWISARNRQRRFVIPDYLVRKHNLLSSVFSPLAADAFLQSFFGIAFNARYVTDSPTEMGFFRKIYATDELGRETAALSARLTHTIPLLKEIPIRTVLKVRRSEPEAFLNYRSAVTKIVRDYVRKGTTIRDNDASEIYLDVLKPQLDALDSQARNVRRIELKRSAAKIVISSALVGLGIYGGLLSPHMVDIVKTIGGFSVGKDLLETIAEIQKNPTDVKNHNLYFLLRLKQAS